MNAMLKLALCEGNRLKIRPKVELAVPLLPLGLKTLLPAPPLPTPDPPPPGVLGEREEGPALGPGESALDGFTRNPS